MKICLKIIKKIVLSAFILYIYNYLLNKSLPIIPINIATISIVSIFNFIGLIGLVIFYNFL